MQSFAVTENDVHKSTQKVPQTHNSFTQKVFQTSFMETGPNTGIFKAKLKIPTTDDAGRSTKGKDLRIMYVDVNNSVTWHDTVTIL